MVIIILRFHCKLGIHMCIIPHSIAYIYSQHKKNTHLQCWCILGPPLLFILCKMYMDKAASYLSIKANWYHGDHYTQVSL